MDFFIITKWKIVYLKTKITGLQKVLEKAIKNKRIQHNIVHKTGLKSRKQSFNTNNESDNPIASFRLNSFNPDFQYSIRGDC